MQQSNHNLCDLLRRNPYPGRGIVLGSSPDLKKTVALYFIMGRSENSQNRIFYKEGDGVRIGIFNRDAVRDLSLIMYRPLREVKKNLILTNGDQTDTIFNSLQQGDSFECALRTRTFEPDAPHFTPRISGLLDMHSGDYRLSILKAADKKGISCRRFFFEYDMQAGCGHFIHTYQTEHDPLPSFVGEPLCVHIPDDPEAFAKEVWQSLEPANRVSLFLRSQDREGHMKTLSIYNRHIE